MPTPTPTLTSVSDLVLTKTHQNSENDKNGGDDHLFMVGDKVTYTLTATNAKTAGPVVSPNAIIVSDIIPIGEKNLQAFGSGWSFTISSTTSPAVITATFVGPFPVKAGESLPPITITAILTEDAVPSITDTATVDTPRNIGTYSTATDTVFVEEQQNPQHHDRDNGNDIHNNNGNTNNNNGNTNTNNSNSNSNNIHRRTNSHRNWLPGLPLTGSDPTPPKTAASHYEAS
ncbi:hypothetical protein [Dictyobacter vulcani]|uniref:hypothetical protein n=1 Tax=Dictyobacter vulcani TaxID=2607529 RepID=UPI0018E94593|nr:hypothetical protein [Dictyobacter vulcani]